MSPLDALRAGRDRVEDGDPGLVSALPVEIVGSREESLAVDALRDARRLLGCEFAPLGRAVRLRVYDRAIEMLQTGPAT